jgi:phosphotriesterase-related protein
MLRRTVLAGGATFAFAAPESVIHTVRGPVEAARLGFTLTHEHLFSNFGGEPAEPAVYETEKLLAAAIPMAERAKSRGARTIFDATTAWFGRAPLLLKQISERAGLHIVTNTGYYGAANDRYVPRHAFEEPAEKIARRWTEEFEKGIGSTGVRPGFIKGGVDPGPLSGIDAKLVRACALTHRATGLTIAVHTSQSAEGALAQLKILGEERVAPSAWIWVHANHCKEDAVLWRVAGQGVWLSFDSLDETNVDRHFELVVEARRRGFLKQTLLSHDGNSFRFGGRPPRLYEALFALLLPRLREAGFVEGEIRQLTEVNPAAAFTVKVRTG